MLNAYLDHLEVLVSYIPVPCPKCFQAEKISSVNVHMPSFLSKLISQTIFAGKLFISRVVAMQLSPA